MLPISDYKNEIIEAVVNHAVTIVSAETGSGKSTQIPQYLSEHFNQIIVTEPRIMAAKTLANRVAEEMGETLGEKIGYRTAYDSCADPNSKILYCTDGLQLIRTIFDEDNETEKVLIIDEVHEWNLNIETLVAWCKFMQKKWNTKVVIMSATMDTTGLANFFGNNVAVLEIPGNLYDVEMEEKPKCEFIDSIKQSISEWKNVLVFVSGKKEIQEVIDELNGVEATILPLHGEMDWEEQKRCFEKYDNPKVIVSTNVAQTSLTIPDIDVVIDTGNAKISIAQNGIQGLYLKDISRSDVMQRKGRAGRTKNGQYILCSDMPFNYRKDYNVPEIKRSILDRVVLQLAEIGLDAEELSFYHQPDVTAIIKAKEELTVLGALSNNKVTKIGHKMVKMPISVQFARMIIEAEKYGVTEQVMIIAAIIEMGGLLSKEGQYYEFTNENESDLLAELDVWNKINKMKYIDFETLGINKKHFFNIKKHIKKMQECLNGIIELKAKDDRKAIINSCATGLISNIYVRNNDAYENNERIVYLDKKSCTLGQKIIIGIPKKIEYKNRYSERCTLNLIGFVSSIDIDTVCKLIPDKIEKEKISERYSKEHDAVKITVGKYFAGVLIDTEITYDKSHLLYSKLKNDYYENDNKQEYGIKQEEVVIDGKKFSIYDSWRNNHRYIYLDNETLFMTREKEIFLDSGVKLYFHSLELIEREESNIIALRNAVEMYRLSRIRKDVNETYALIRIKNLKDVILNANKIGEVKLTMNNGGYGNEPVLVYGYVELKKNMVTMKVCDDKCNAENSTIEALQYLFLKEIEKEYGENKFSHQQEKKKKNLTKKEMETKKDFDSLVRELTLNLTLENAVESLEFLEEYYKELMATE